MITLRCDGDSWGVIIDLENVTNEPDVQRGMLGLIMLEVPRGPSAPNPQTKSLGNDGAGASGKGWGKAT